MGTQTAECFDKGRLQGKNASRAKKIIAARRRFTE